MPRKPKLPIPDLHIEGLSGSAPKAQPTVFIDDFSDAVISMSHEAVQAQRKHIGPRQRKQRIVHRAMQQRAQAQTSQALAQSADQFIKQRMQPTLYSPAKPGERSITLGADLVIIMPAKPWRRF